MNITRRTFVKSSALIPFLPSLSYSKIIGSNERLNIALIGVGGMGNAHATDIVNRKKRENVNITHVCDLYQKRLNAAANLTGGLPTMEYQEILDANDVDVVIIAMIQK